MREPRREDVDALVGPATPHFAPQIRARVEELVLALPDTNPVKQYAKEKIEMLERLALEVGIGHGQAGSSNQRAG